MREDLEKAYIDGWLMGLTNGEKVFRLLAGSSLRLVGQELAGEFTRQLLSRSYTGVVFGSLALARLEGIFEGAIKARLIFRDIVTANQEAPIGELEDSFTEQIRKAKLFCPAYPFE